MKFRSIRCILLFLAVFFPFVLSSPHIQAKAGDSRQNPLPESFVHQEPIAQGTLKTLSTFFPNGDYYWHKRLTFNHTESAPYETRLHIPGENGTFRYIQTAKNGQKVWKIIPLKGTLPKAAGFISTDLCEVLIGYPAVYKPLSNQALEEDPRSIPIEVKNEANSGYTLKIKFPITKNRMNEIWALESIKPLVDWSRPRMEQIWKNLDFISAGKWTIDGMYRETPSTYSPHGPNVYWRFPDNYSARSFIGTGNSRAAEDLGWVMVLAGLENQNFYGFWETGPRSEWLWEEYRIGPGFYDTRFNTDFALLLLKAYQKYRDPAFLAGTEKYAEWLLGYIHNEKVEVSKGNKTGWLVPDYWHPKQHIKPHTSLNHQLAETVYLYELYLETKDSRYKDCAEMLLTGVKNTRDIWVKENKDLFYAYFHGKGIRRDYPYLTYNDLWDTQRLLTIIHGEPDPDLAALMASKKIWMDRQKITKYKR